MRGRKPRNRGATIPKYFPRGEEAWGETPVMGIPWLFLEQWPSSSCHAGKLFFLCLLWRHVRNNVIMHVRRRKDVAFQISVTPPSSRMSFHVGIIYIYVYIWWVRVKTCGRLGGVTEIWKATSFRRCTCVMMSRRAWHHRRHNKNNSPAWQPELGHCSINSHGIPLTGVSPHFPSPLGEVLWDNSTSVSGLSSPHQTPLLWNMVEAEMKSLTWPYWQSTPLKGKKWS